MFLSLLQFFVTKFLVLALHLESGSFPRPLSVREEYVPYTPLYPCLKGYNTHKRKSRLHGRQ